MEESESQPDLNFFTPSSSPTAAGDGALPLPSTADGPILICSLPDTPDAGADLGFRLVRRDKAKAKSPPPQAPAEPSPPPPNAGGGGRTFKKKKKKSRVSRNPRGLHISGGTPSPPPPTKPHQDQQATKSVDDIDKFRYQSIDALKAAASSRKVGDSGGTSSAAAPTQKPAFPASLEDVVDRLSGAPSPPKVGDSGGTSYAAAAAAATGGKPLFPASLEDVVNHFSGEPDMRFADMDILEIAAMKGIHFPQPSWWRPGGYDAKPKKK